MRVTYYDHYGLDVRDVDSTSFFPWNPASRNGFRQWFILQHWNGLNASPQPKPFVTTMEEIVAFSGYLN